MTSIEKICKEAKITKHELVTIIRRFCCEKNCRLTNLEKSPMPKLCAAVEKYNIPILEIKKKLDEEKETEKAEKAKQKIYDEGRQAIMAEKRKKDLKRVEYWNAHPHKMAFVKRFVLLNRQFSDAEIARNVEWNEQNKDKNYILQRSWELMMEQQILGKSALSNHRIDDNSYMVHGVIVRKCGGNNTRRTTKLTEEEIQKEIKKHASGTYFEVVVECMYMKPPEKTKFFENNLRPVNHVIVPIEGTDRLKLIRINKKLLQ